MLRTIRHAAAQIIALTAMLCATAPRGLWAQTYDFSVVPATSSTAYDFAVDIPFVTDPSSASSIIGSYDPVTNTTGTLTIPGLFGGDTSVNTPVPITQGGFSATGDSGTNPLKPTGSFVLSIDPVTSLCLVSGLNLDLSGGATATIGASLSIQYSTFRTRQPSCILPGGFPISLPLGDVQVTSMTVIQSPGPALGTLTPDAPDHFLFSIPVDVAVSARSSFNGSPINLPPQMATIMFSGGLTISDSTASVAVTLDIINNQSVPFTTPLPPLPFPEPLCGGNLIINLTVSGATINLATSADLAANGIGRCAPGGASPLITQQPAAPMLHVGQRAVMLITVDGGSPLTYQWRKDGANLQGGLRFSGVSSATLILGPVQSGDSGRYDVIVYDDCGLALSEPADITILPRVNGAGGSWQLYR